MTVAPSTATALHVARARPFGSGVTTGASGVASSAVGAEGAEGAERPAPLTATTRKE